MLPTPSGRMGGRRNILNILRGGITADQLARMQNGQVPGQENGAFAGQHLTASTLQALAALLAQASPNGLFQLPGQAQIPQFQYQPRPPAPIGREGNHGLHLGFQNPHNPHFQPGGGGGPMFPGHGVAGHGGFFPSPVGGQHLLGNPIVAPHQGQAPMPPLPRGGGQKFYPLLMQRALGR